MNKIIGLIFCSAAVFAAEDVVLASRFGYQAADATECLQKALNSGAKKVRIDKQAGDWIICPVKVPSNTEVVIDPGVTVRAKKGEYKELNDTMFFLWDVENVTISGGKDSRLVMNKVDYQDAKQYKQGEWRNIIGIHSSSNITVRGLILETSGGDGVYVGCSNRPDPCVNVTLEDLNSVGNHRQGLSVVSCETLRVRRCRFHNTSGTSPMAGIDFEPNKARETLMDCLVEDCQLFSNQGFGLLLHMYQLNAKTRPVSITIRNCDISDGKNGAVVVNSSSGMSQVRGSIRFENCRITGAEGGSVEVRNQRADGFSLTFDKCTVDNAKGKTPAFRIISEGDSAIGNFAMNGMDVKDPNHTEWCALESSGAKPALTGQLSFNGKSVDLKSWSSQQKVVDTVPFTPAKLDVKKLTASPGVCQAVPGFRFRENFCILQYAAAGSEVEFTVNNISLGTDIPFRVDFLDPNGKKFNDQVMKPGANQIKFTAKETGVYSFPGKTNGAAMSVVSTLPGNGFAATGMGMFASRNRKLYFEVPAGAKDVMIRLRGNPGEAVSVRIFNGRGQLMGELKDVILATAFRHTRVFAEQAEIWTLEFTRMVEDSSLELGGDLNPVVALSPELLPRAPRK